MSPILIAALVLFLVYFFPRCHKYVCHMIHLWKLGSKIPGPPAWPIIGNALQIPHETHDWTPFFYNLANEYLSKGHNVIRLWMVDNLKVIPLNGESMKDILDSSVEITKSNDYDIVQPWLGTGLLIATGEKWRQRRKLLTPTFHFNMLDGYVTTFDTHSKILTDVLDEFALSGETVDAFPFIKRCALDVICDAAMGFQLDSQTNRHHPYAVAVGDMGRISTLYGIRPWMWLSPVWYLGGWAKSYNHNLKVLTDFTKEVIHERQLEISKNGFEDNGGRKAFLDFLLQMKDANLLTDEDIREEVDTFMFEGHDTTSSGIAWILWCLATHPDIQEKVSEELVELFEGSDRAMTVDDVKCLPYLERVIKESMRINPPVPFVGRALVNDTKIGDCLAPRGTQVLISPLMLHRNEQVYPDHMKFDPDRFLPENVLKRHAYDYIAFSAGPRNCIGQKFAMYEEKVMVSWIIRRFKISTEMGFLENGRCPEVILRPQHGIPLKLERRSE